MTKNGRQGTAYKAADFIEHIPGSGGIISTIARRVGCSWHTAQKYINDHATVRQAYADECESVLDMAEGVLMKGIKDGDTGDAKWYLSRKGKQRGYADKLELEQSGTVTIVSWDEPNGKD